MFSKYKYIKGDVIKTIGGLIPIHKTTLLHGRSGSGKTLSIIKFLIEHNQKIMLMDFDTNDEYNDMDMVHVDGYKMVQAIKSKEIKPTAFKGYVVIIDTYTKCDAALKDMSVEDLAKGLNKGGATVVVIAHTDYFSGKPAEPQTDKVFANHCACRLHLHNDVKLTKTTVYLEIEKLRGKSSQLIMNWMR